MNRSVFALLVLAATACQGESAPEYLVVSEDGMSRQGEFCGGFAGVECPEGKVCVDDPTDSCDPNNGGADCAGICVNGNNGGGNGGGNGGNGNGQCGSPQTKTYVGNSPEECAVISFVCAEGYTAFFNDCGCGCELDPEPAGVACGPNTCAAGDVCCNESCGICTPPGGFCTQQVCY